MTRVFVQYYAVLLKNKGFARKFAGNIYMQMPETIHTLPSNQGPLAAN